MGDPIKVGGHDKGTWDIENKVNADKSALAGNLNINDAIARAKANPGAELVIVDEKGSASVHSLSIQDGFKEGKVIDYKELKRGQNTKGPLELNDHIAGLFRGKSAFMVDNKNNVTYLGSRVAQTNAEITFKDAEEYLSAPTKNKVDTAYQMAGEAGNVKRIEVKLANNVINDLTADYKNTTNASAAVSTLKPGVTKAVMEKLISDLNSLEDNRTKETAAFSAELAARTDKYKAELAKPAERLTKADTAWKKAHGEEEQKVAAAYKNAREAKMPGIYKLEDDFSRATSERNTAKSNMDSAIRNRVDAQARLASIERIPSEIDHLRDTNATLGRNNVILGTGLVSYVAATKLEIAGDISEKNRLISSYQRQIDSEYAKPTRPANSGSVYDDPFNKPGNGNTGSVYDDPFKKPGSGNNGSVTDDPFANSNNYRNQGMIDEWTRQRDRLRSDVSILNSRASSLDSLAYKLSYSSDLRHLNSYSRYGMHDADRIVVDRYLSNYAGNVSQINANEQAIREKDYTYRNNIGPARNNLTAATASEETARTVYGTAEARLAHIGGQLDQLKRNPKADTDPKVKPFVEAYNKAVSHREATVGPAAPLTRELNSAKSVVDGINQVYNTDKQAIEAKIRGSNDSTQDRAQKIIRESKAKL